MPTLTHDVLNQSLPFEDVNLFDSDLALREGLEREGARWAVDRARDTGAVAGSAEALEHGRRAERNEPRLLTHDRFGHRIDQVELDPSWHWLLRGAVEREIHSLPWRVPQRGAHVARAALELLWTHANAGVMCPVSMTYSAVPALRTDADLAAEWEPRLTLPDYERGALCGMAMTEKQGGSDVRANTTRAEPAGDGWWELTGHKWFCSYPPCDVFLVLAQAPAGLTCFVVERGPGMEIQRLKDKLGTRSLPSSEVEPIVQSSRVWLTISMIVATPRPSSPTSWAQAPRNSTSLDAFERLPTLSLSRTRRKPLRSPSGVQRGKRKHEMPRSA